MLFAGAGGLATQVFEDIVATGTKEIVFWSEFSTKYPFIADHFPILNNDDAVRQYFQTVSPEFVLCIGGKTAIRKKIYSRLTKLGGIFTSFISPFSRISPYGTTFGQGTIILNQVNVEPSVKLGAGCLLNKTANVGHGCVLGSWCEVGPGVIFTGEVEMGENGYVGTGAILHPKIKIGKNVTISAGSVVTKNIEDNAVVAGVPAQIKFIRKNDSEHMHDYV